MLIFFQKKKWFNLVKLCALYVLYLCSDASHAPLRHLHGTLWNVSQSVSCVQAIATSKTFKRYPVASLMFVIISQHLVVSAA